MTILPCKGCGARYDVTRFAPGTRMKCRKCAAVLTVPDRAAPARPPAPRAAAKGPDRGPGRRASRLSGAGLAALHHQAGGMGASGPGAGQELGPFLQGLDLLIAPENRRRGGRTLPLVKQRCLAFRRCHAVFRGRHGPARLRRQPLAALGPAAVHDLAAVLGRHARTKPVAALADEPARLKGALHFFLLCPGLFHPVPGLEQVRRDRLARDHDFRDVANSERRRIARPTGQVNARWHRYCHVSAATTAINPL